MDAFRRAFAANLLVRVTGDTIALSPPLVLDDGHIDRIASTLRAVLTALP